MATQHIDTLIIGAGQAGLATGYHLKRLGREVDARWAWSMTCTGPGAAYERRDWLSAYRTLSDLDESALTAGDYAALATTAYLLGRHNDCVQAFQRAYQVNAEQGGQLAAARSALRLAMVLFEGGEAAIAGGWIGAGAAAAGPGRGGRRRTRLPAPAAVVRSPRQGRVRLGRGECRASHPLRATVPRPDLLAVGLSFQGWIEIYSGRVADGLRVLDEAMVAVLADEISPVFSGLVYCSAIEACQEVSDLGRADEWTHALSNWCDSQPGLVAFTGQCAGAPRPTDAAARRVRRGTSGA